MRQVAAYPVILASASPRRRTLLREMGITEFRVEPSGVEEIPAHPGVSAPDTALLNAELKAADVAARFSGALVIGADTLVVCSRRIFGKPRDEDEAFAMLRALSGREHQVVTAVALRINRISWKKSFVETSRVTFKKLSDAAIREYLRLAPVLDKAGAYAIQEHGELILKQLHGSLANVIGLPTERLRKTLHEEQLLV